MLEAVPARVVGGVPQPEVGPLVDDGDAPGEEVRDPQGRGAMGQGKEDGIDVAVELALERQLGRGEVRMDAPDGIAAPLATGQPDELDRGMGSQEPDELAADVAGRADDPDPDRGATARRRMRGRSGARSVGLAMDA
jgi:hypothetical protein